MLKRVCQILDVSLAFVFCVVTPIRFLYFPKYCPAVDQFFAPVFVLGILDMAIVSRTKLYGTQKLDRILLKLKLAFYFIPILIIFSVLVLPKLIALFASL